jgi:fibro-slime domain-containing protein
MGSQSRAAVVGALALAVAACSSAGGGDHHGNGADAGVGDGDGGIFTTNDSGMPVDQCLTLQLTMRDFTPATHADFELDIDPDVGLPGLVEAKLGADHTPTYAPSGPTVMTTGPAEFAQWYHDTPGINMTFPVTLPLTLATGGKLTYDSSAFYPLDGKGFGDTYLGDDGKQHNFHFTTEIHTTFDYAGGETFTFKGDDDLWLFINERLAIDLGGLHPEETGTVDLDASAAALGITKGNRYRMDVFHAERHTDSSNFHLETTIQCFVIP